MVSTEFDKRLEANIRESLRFAVGQVDEEAVAHMVAGVNAVLNHPSAPAPSSHLRGLDKATMQKLREALRFSASRSVMSSDDERRILAAFDTPPQEHVVPDFRALAVEIERLRQAMERSIQVAESWDTCDMTLTTRVAAQDIAERIRAIASEGQAE